MNPFIDRRMAEEIEKAEREKKKEALRNIDIKITSSVLLRCLKAYDPCFVSIWNAKKQYQQFHNDMGLLVLKMKEQEVDKK